MIKMQVIGHLGKDCIVNNVNGKNVINFTIAHSEKYKDSQGNNQERTTWVDCAWWTDRTGISQYLIKGKQVYVEGSPEVRSFTRQDGTSGATLSMRVREVQLLSSRNDGPGFPTQTTGTATGTTTTVSNTTTTPPAGNSSDDSVADDLPF
ncbi:MAG: single-stranded DNA-binding protein [Niabella sp.]|nr:MAG: single-stranded DNA-binding protein [Niabella sp.]